MVANSGTSPEKTKLKLLTIHSIYSLIVIAWGLSFCLPLFNLGAVLDSNTMLKRDQVAPLISVTGAFGVVSLTTTFWLPQLAIMVKWWQFGRHVGEKTVSSDGQTATWILSLLYWVASLAVLALISFTHWSVGDYNTSVALEQSRHLSDLVRTVSIFLAPIAAIHCFVFSDVMSNLGAQEPKKDVEDAANGSPPDTGV